MIIEKKFPPIQKPRRGEMIIVKITLIISQFA